MLKDILGDATIGIVKRNEIIRLIGKDINTAYSIGKALNLDPRNS